MATFRKNDGTWTIPVSLGPKTNDGLAHRWGNTYHPTESIFIYTHGTSEKDCAVFWVRFDKLLESLRPK